MVQVTNEPETDNRTKVAVSDYSVRQGGRLTTSGLGSCLAVAVYDRREPVGGLVHPMLPERGPDADRPPERFVDSGIDVVLETMIDQGARMSRLEAKVVGGASILQFASNDGAPIGERNVAVAHQVLDQRGIPIVAEETGGDSGRRVSFDAATGDVHVRRGDGAEYIL